MQDAGPGRLERFPAPSRRRGAFAFDGSPALKDPIGAAGIPHVEIVRVGVDDRDVAPIQRLRGGQSVDVFPRLVQHAGDPPRFVLDVHLGRSAGCLRLLGIDTACRNDADDDALATCGIAEVRVLPTRDTGLLKRAPIGRPSSTPQRRSRSSRR
ncbi:MAG TPA: Mut7-C RNAse domain-containing protein [Lysobacter sp.]